MILLTIIIFIAILGLLVFVHELGHFIMAKRAGMRVEEFGFGFPPRFFGIKRGETIYSINWIPLGGFVKITGEDGAESQDSKSFANKSAWQRFFVLVAGVSMNVVLAWILIAIGLGLGLPTVIHEGESLPASARVKNPSITIIDLAADSPASSVGIKAGDSIIKVGGEIIASIEQLQELTRQNVGRQTVYEIRRGDSTFEKNLVPRENPPEGQGPLGIGLAMVARVSYPWYQLLPRGFVSAFSLVGVTISAFAEVIGSWLQGASVAVAVSGPVGIAVLTRDVAELGFIYILQFTALLSINLAVINAVPFPALDGGRVLFLAIETIRRKKLPAKAEQAANTIGFGLLLLLMVLVTIKDVSRYSENFKNLFQRIF
ncbi:MAG: RIP metalloprotease RseP [Candidatus Doudnabacteria bacterium RIFCSPLOWO2_02_FULL_48_8]|uniref:Zinc metalloprotease n=1 Tax=Candidatus Doudnabacteria bacterium RIFCSPHIGHO2_01_FULL_46_24 TaxID=1817825 RepID=A0A1F5NUT4_9BACT|nr:MAG: RIP metalloprotease RseP [Candidatus Doudnabacteria bacterium RIFCSPHIGHO2_01_FULL_46_24]OGE95001.1 MAG: RIP metalloprotease RseP [Candidatus Doudnabacteria bacterium RIFCSPLOWO2_02_FULL_48_8]OGE96184.1 MAG: RIP metalloprotease RseP [Candidatus Doudnabacteria bacterium RIFCSPHIGHO2_12_FULL_48_11]